MVTDTQVRRLMKLMQTQKSLALAAAKAGMDEKTARKYRNLGRLPSEVRAAHTWRTRDDPFARIGGQFEMFLTVRRQSKSVPYALHRRLRHASGYGQGSARPVCCVLGPHLQYFAQQRGNALVANRARPPRAVVRHTAPSVFAPRNAGATCTRFVEKDEPPGRWLCSTIRTPPKEQFAPGAPIHGEASANRQTNPIARVLFRSTTTVEEDEA